MRHKRKLHYEVECWEVNNSNRRLRTLRKALAYFNSLPKPKTLWVFYKAKVKPSGLSWLQTGWSYQKIDDF